MKYKLNVEIKFTDKYTNKKYKIGDVITVEEARAKELLEDSRKLVSVNEKIEDEVEKAKKEEAKRKAEEEAAKLKAEQEAKEKEEAKNKAKIEDALKAAKMASKLGK